MAGPGGVVKRGSTKDDGARRSRPGGQHIIIIGAGPIGFALAKALAPRHSIFVIDHDQAVAESLANLDVQFVHGSATSANVLKRAQVEQADLLVACTGLDEVNIVACSIANRLGKPETICMVSKDDFLRPADGGDSLREHFGIDHIVWPEAQLADDIERVIAVPGAIDVEMFAEGRIQLVEYKLTASTPLTRRPIADLGLPRGALVVAVKHRDQFFIPNGATRLSANDKIIMMGSARAMHEVQDLVVADQPKRRRTVVTIIGGGDVGFRLAQRLDMQSGVELRVIESDPERGELIASTLQRALVLTGDGTDLELLESEQIGRSDVLVSVIDNDEKNLLASLLGRQLGVGKVITRVGTPSNLRLFERVGIDVAISARGAAVAAIRHVIEGGPSSLLAVLEEGQARVLELEVPAGFPPTSLRDMQAPPESIVGAIIRGRNAIVPRGDDQIEPGDRLIVFATSTSADQVRDYFAVSRP
jgi:trk system potassium uptake protein TrkA